MPNKLFNLARMTTATTGTGTVTLGSAVSGYLTFALAGVADGDVVSYAIKDGAASEIGTGTYTSSGTTLTRSVTKSTNSDAALNLSGTAEVFITPRAEDLTTTTAATQTEMEAGSSLLVTVTPGRQQFHPSAAKFWGYVTYSAGTPTLQTSFNVTSITDAGVGVLTVTIATDFSSANWAPWSCGSATSFDDITDYSINLAAGSVDFRHRETNAPGSAPAAVDPARLSFGGFGDQ